MCSWLQIYADSKLKDHIVDALLERRLNDFYYSSCDKYALRDLLISQREQVSGRKQYGRFDLYIDYDRAVELVEYFYTKYGKDDITCYMLQNITDFES